MVEIKDKRGLTEEAETVDREEAESVEPENAGEPKKALVVTDKRFDTEHHYDPRDTLLAKVFTFVLEQPEFYNVLQLSRAERKNFAKHIAKTMTNFPHFMKMGAGRGD